MRSRLRYVHGGLRVSAAGAWMIWAMDALRLPDGPLDVLCVGAHPGDVEVGGGTLQLGGADQPAADGRGPARHAGPRGRVGVCARQEILPSVNTRFAALPVGRRPSHTSAPSSASAGNVVAQATLRRPTGEQLRYPPVPTI